MSDKAAETITERASVHGEYSENSRGTWAIMGAMMAERNWPTLSAEARHALYMIAHKMSRIVAGDPGYTDHWLDIEGYARLVRERLEHPVVPYSASDLYGSLALAWNVSRQEARKRAAGIAYTMTQGREATEREALTENRKNAERELLEWSALEETVAAPQNQPEPPAEPRRPVRPGGPVAEPADEERIRAMFAVRPGGPVAEPADEAQGSPADGGHHASQDEQELAEQLEASLSEDTELPISYDEALRRVRAAGAN